MWSDQIRAYLPRYPSKQAVTLPALHIVHEHFRCVPCKAIEEIAHIAESNAAGTQEASAATQEQTASMQDMSASAQQLARTSDGLKELVTVFKI